MAVAHKRQTAFAKVVSAFTELQTQNSLADTVFRVGNDGNTKDFQVVGAIFAIQSPAFKSLLFGRLSEAQPSINVADNTQSIASTDNLIARPKKIVRLDDASPEAFQYIQSFFYGTQPSLNENIVANVTYLSKKYLLTPLYELAVAFMSNLSPGDIPGFLKAISQVYEYGLKDEGMDMAHSCKNTGNLQLSP